MSGRPIMLSSFDPCVLKTKTAIRRCPVARYSLETLGDCVNQSWSPLAMGSIGTIQLVRRRVRKPVVCRLPIESAGRRAHTSAGSRHVAESSTPGRWGKFHEG
jgi:hypothetical protein